MRGESESGREGENVRHFSITFGSQSDQLNHLPPAEGENVRHFSITFGSQSDQLKHLPLTTGRFKKKTLIIGFVRVLSALYRRSQSHIFYRILDLTIRKLQTDTRTHIFIEIISNSTDLVKHGKIFESYKN